MDDAYDSYGITVKTWSYSKVVESIEKSYDVMVWAVEVRKDQGVMVSWMNPRRVIERDGLISLQVTIHRSTSCACKRRVEFVKQWLADQNVQCFWTQEPDDDDSLYVTVGPRPPHMSTRSFLFKSLGLFVRPYSSPKQVSTTNRRTKAGRRNRRHSVQ
jgi:hypothetical protein